MPILTYIDILGIQKYVFASNRLRDVVAGSALVNMATSQELWLKQWQKHVVLAGGGNALLSFEDLQQAKSFAASYTFELLTKARGLDVVVVHHSYTEGQLAKGIQELLRRVNQAKSQTNPSVPMLGFSLNQRCAETGLPAVEHRSLGETRLPISVNIQHRQRNAIRPELMCDALVPGFQFPSELDEMGRSVGEKSAIAVVHLDANGLGDRFNKALAGWATSNKDDSTVVEEYRQQSEQVEKKINDVFCSAVKLVAENCEHRVLKGRRAQFTLQSNSAGTYLPLRPVVVGGDDVTFVCDGRLAFELTVFMLGQFGQDVGSFKTVNACAGIAIVKSHFPFSKAYELAEQLCASAKHDCEGDNALAWQVGLNGLSLGTGIHAPLDLDRAKQVLMLLQDQDSDRNFWQKQRRLKQWMSELRPSGQVEQTKWPMIKKLEDLPNDWDLTDVIQAIELSDLYVGLKIL